MTATQDTKISSPFGSFLLHPTKDISILMIQWLKDLGFLELLQGFLELLQGHIIRENA